MLPCTLSPCGAASRSSLCLSPPCRQLEDADAALDIAEQLHCKGEMPGRRPWSDGSGGDADTMALGAAIAGFKLDKKVYTCLIRTYSLVGDVDRAMQVVTRLMSPSLHELIWTAGGAPDEGSRGPARRVDIQHTHLRCQPLLPQDHRCVSGALLQLQHDLLMRLLQVLATMKENDVPADEVAAPSMHCPQH